MTRGPEESRIVRFTTQRSARCIVRGPEDPAAVRELWVVLHGYAQLATDFVAAFGPSTVDDGTRLIVAPEALSRFYDSQSEPESHGDASTGASWMTREERAYEIEDYLAWLQMAYESFASAVPTGIPITVLGFSQGAAAASRWVAGGRVPAARLICWGSSIAPELDLGPASPLRRARTYLVIGERDKFAGEARVAAERARLDAAGFSYTFVSFSGGHRLDDDTMRRLAADTGR